jgi:ferritin
MRIQALEEMTHGERFFHFICDAGGRTNLLPIDGPRNEFKSPLDAFEFGLNHEKFVTESIGKLVELARKEKHHAAEIMLNWFVTEQVEEESNFSLLIRKLKRVEGDGRGLLMLDQELGQRVFVPPAATGA